MTTTQRRVVGLLLLAVAAAAALTLGYSVVGERIAAFCLNPTREEVTP